MYAPHVMVLFSRRYCRAASGPPCHSGESYCPKLMLYFSAHGFSMYFTVEPPALFKWLKIQQARGGVASSVEEIRGTSTLSSASATPRAIVVVAPLFLDMESNVIASPVNVIASPVSRYRCRPMVGGKLMAPCDRWKYTYEGEWEAGVREVQRESIYLPL